MKPSSNTSAATVAAACLLLFAPAQGKVFNYTFYIDGELYENTGLLDTEFNPIFAPATGEVVQTGSTYTIRWKQTNTQGMSFDLCLAIGDTTFSRVPLAQSGYIGVNEQNTGSYVWKVADTIPSGNNYVFLFDDGLVTGGISPTFAISNAKIAASAVSTASTASTSFRSSSTTSMVVTGQASLATSITSETGGTVSTTSATGIGSSVTTPAPSSQTTSEPPSQTTSSSGSSNGSSNNSSSAVIGDSVGGALGGVILILSAAIFFILRRKRSSKKIENEENPDNKPELDDTSKQRAAANATTAGVQSVPTQDPDRMRRAGATELPVGSERGLHELSGAREPVFELSGTANR